VLGGVSSREPHPHELASVSKNSYSEAVHSLCGAPGMRSCFEEPQELGSSCVPVLKSCCALGSMSVTAKGSSSGMPMPYSFHFSQVARFKIQDEFNQGSHMRIVHRGPLIAAGWHKLFHPNF